MPGHYGKKRNEKKRTDKKMDDFILKQRNGPKARTGSFPTKPKPAAGAKAMKAATMALLKKKKKK